MSWDVEIEGANGEVLRCPTHHVTGGTFIIGGTDRLWLNITYNYSKFFRAAMGGEGINDLQGKTVAECVSVVREAIAKMKPEPATGNYWDSTEGNARAALVSLLTLLTMAPADGVVRLS